MAKYVQFINRPALAGQKLMSCAADILLHFICIYCLGCPAIKLVAFPKDIVSKALTCEIARSFLSGKRVEYFAIYKKKHSFAASNKRYDNMARFVLK